MPKIDVIIPIKEKSQRIKNKNFKTFNGEPLFCNILKKINKLSIIDNIYLNTDCKNKIKKNLNFISKKIKFIERDKSLLGHDISVNLIIESSLKYIKDNSTILMTHVTNPNLSKKTIKKSIDTYLNISKSNKYDSLFSVNRYQNRFYDHHLNPLNHSRNKLIQTQDLKPMFEENSLIYIFSKKSFYKNKSRIGSKPYLFITNKNESTDIDDKEDWDIAKKLSI